MSTWLVKCPKTNKIKVVEDCYRCDELNYMSTYSNAISCKPDGIKNVQTNLIDSENLE